MSMNDHSTSVSYTVLIKSALTDIYMYCGCTMHAVRDYA